MANSTDRYFLHNDSVCKSLAEKCRRLFHIGPIFGFSLVFGLSICSISVCVSTLLPKSTLFGSINLAVFCCFSFLTLRSYALSAWYGPGFVKLKWSPVSLIFVNDISDNFMRLTTCYIFLHSAMPKMKLNSNTALFVKASNHHERIIVKPVEGVS